MTAFVCTACGTQYPESTVPPPRCPICEEERQYVPPTGQGWTTLERMRLDRQNAFRQHAPGITGVVTYPHFAIGQQAILVQTPHGNVLWDCIALIDDATVAIVKALGGIKAIAISHPHYYTTHAEWTRAFGCKVYLHAADREWVQRPSDDIVFWDGETLPLLPDITLVRCGGHYPGGAVLHWAGGASGKGVVCAGDILSIAPDRKWMSFMHSYPNLIPLSARVVEAVGQALAPFSFDAIYGHFPDRVIAGDGKGALERSVKRYVERIRG